MRWLPILFVLGCAGVSTPAGPAEDCANLVDDDSDGLTDCADDDCSASCPEICADDVDNDGDGALDCADPDCDGMCPEICDDGRDNDHDGAIDCDDLDCRGSCPEVCGDGVDNDGDGAVDCLDSDCSDPACEEICSDGRDNDADGAIDCSDADCDGGCPEVCDDGRDNDGDDLADCLDHDCDGACPEACDDGRDNDGDGDLDCDDADCESTCDGDGDGFVDHALGGPDCDDGDPAVHPLAPEVCDGADNDCDGLFDAEDPQLDRSTLIEVYVDADGDGYGRNGGPAVRACAPGSGQVDVSGDCNDLDPAVHPEATEVCNGIDDDCNGLGDDNDPDLDPTSLLTWYLDGDRDGFGDAAVTIDRCRPPIGYVDNGDDCDDAVRSIGGPVDWLVDNDADGFGTGLPVGAPSCDPPGDGYVDAAWDGDCDDADDQVHPAAFEVCNGLDDDCDTLADDADPDVVPGTLLPFYADADGDGFGNAASVRHACEAPSGFVEEAGDCNDARAEVNPDAVEVCNGLDDDCDGRTDDNDPDLDPASTSTWYADFDGDGLGDPEVAFDACAGPPASVDNDDDCDDSDPGVGLPIAWVLDVDLDGVGAGTPTDPACDPPGTSFAPADAGEDCDDFDADVSPLAVEVCDGKDNDCDALTDEDDDSLDWSSASQMFFDGDGDGFGDPRDTLFACAEDGGYVLAGGDCDDDDPAVHPAAAEVCNLLDDDCDGLVDDDDPSVDPADQTTWYADGDGDGAGRWPPVATLCEAPDGTVDNPDDCADRDPSVTTAQTWMFDDDGDGVGAGPPTDDATCMPPDDGWVPTDAGTDCDDADPHSYPGAPEVCEDTVDQDCNGSDPPCRLCSEVATEWCESKGWIVVADALDGNLVCTVDGRDYWYNCDDCSTYQILVWEDGSPDRVCPAVAHSTVAGEVYGGHASCSCVDDLQYCESWPLEGCTPD